MPRRPPRESAIQAANTFVHILIAESKSDDHIIPKNGKFSPFHGFIRMMSQHANVRDGGTSVDGVSRACLNKLVGTYYQEGMRKPARNGNPGDLEPGSCRLARHFLKARWRDPDDQEDLMVLQQIFSVMQRHEVDNCITVLREFSKWRPGPAGRGGDRFHVRPGPDAGMDAVDMVLRNVRRRIEASRAEAEPGIASEEENDDWDDDAMSMRSTVVQGPISKPNPTKHVQSEPIDKVQALQGIIQEIRNSNMAWANHRSNSPSAGLQTMTQTAGSACLSSQEGVQKSTVTSSKSLSSADLLHNLFRQVASQQKQQASTSGTGATIATSWPMASCEVSNASHADRPSQRFPSAMMLAGAPPILASLPMPQPSRDDIINASAARVQQLCAPFAGGTSRSDQHRPLSLSSMNLPPADLTLPPLKHVLLQTQP